VDAFAGAFRGGALCCGLGVSTVTSGKVGPVACAVAAVLKATDSVSTLHVVTNGCPRTPQGPTSRDARSDVFIRLPSTDELDSMAGFPSILLEWLAVREPLQRSAVMAIRASQALLNDSQTLLFSSIIKFDCVACHLRKWLSCNNWRRSHRPARPSTHTFILDFCSL
jgi:hypothetical protein